jgi:hypothetical protein
MPDYSVNVEPIASNTDGNVDYAVTTTDGRAFRLGFARPLLDVWEAQLSRSDTSVELDEIADRLARDIAAQDPAEEQLSEGFIVTLDNGFATPIAAEENLKNSGVVAFSATRSVFGAARR